MRVLAIDTTGPACSLALADFGEGEIVLGRIVEPMQRGHAEALMPLMDKLFSEAGASSHSVERIAVTVGPGSFTGLRVGVSAARALALALGVPAVGVSVFEAIREHLGPRDAPLAVAIDARRDEIYLQVFPAAAQAEDPMVMAVQGAAGVIPPGCRVIGSAATLLGHDPGPEVLPLDPVAIARAGRRLEPARFPPRPLYLRKPDAKPQTHTRVARA
ncbi:MAG: tRNA (adenosine(37)-N6)-threonylcarbamoyltransferase complex dimerization subunit type 1 TsaB [Tepidamorphaceae bacterium]|nr:tRNA (adenosine(37)-N6)-threonylcarbamoyltransferase complex dimerization subunit type 1 TsaB [Rhodobiaceae bacterium]MCC0049231.1 tRNA (adenosine(37)-N6)-threonylcarbamoyltransferase complex dimerization subunit type 1 TsaB [Rhodobiaceae bacterium]